MLKITYQVKISGCFTCFIKYNVYLCSTITHISNVLNIKVMTTKKYFKTRQEANKVCKERQQTNPAIKVWKMPKGTRHHGEFAVCDEMTFLNTY